METASNNFSSQEKFYIREPSVQEEIERLNSLTPVRRLSILASSSASTSISLETLTYYLRRSNQEGASKDCSAIMKSIVRRVSPRLARLARIWRLGYPPDLAEDVADHLLTLLYDALLNDTEAHRFWEIRFWVCFNRMATKALKQRRADLDLILADEGDAEDDSLDPDRFSDNRSKSYSRDNPETRAIISDALSRLPEPLKTAFLLRHWSGYPVDISSDGSPSISSIMGVSDRSVRNYLSRAEKELSMWRSEEFANG
jgi:DNA-directed RNA polymerase specialized sigma24 family protein